MATRWIAAVAAAAAIAGVFLGWRTLTPAPLTFDVDSSAIANRGYLLVPDSAPSAHLRFSDGSDLTLEPGARGRVAELRADGAAIGLESGKASLHVVHRPDTHWSVNAGPFAITVTGTAFDVSWSGVDELFEVTLRSGAIIIRGPLAPSGIRLTAGEKLVANLKTNRVDVGPIAAANPAQDSVVSSPPTSGLPDDAAPRKPGITSQPRAGGASSPNEAKSSWSKRVAAGDFDGVLADAHQAGLDAVLARSGLADLVALADAARYKGRADLARLVLAAQRERFPSSSAARTAAFLLGRLAESEPESAIGWYERYLNEAPTGEFASEALGRKLVLVHRVSGSQAARPIAEEYVRRFPGGAYAARARELSLQ